MPDRPDYTKPIAFALQEVPDWGRRDWAAKEAEMKSWTWEKTTPLAPHSYYTGTVYTVPADKRLWLTDVGMGGEYIGVVLYKIKDKYNLWSALTKSWVSILLTFSVPHILESGDILQDYAENWDIVSGKPHGFFLGFEVPASKPKPVKSDDPEERYKKGDFNYANIYHISKEDTLFIFYKLGEKKKNYLLVKDYTGSREKVIARRHLLKYDKRNLSRMWEADIKKSKYVK